MKLLKFETEDTNLLSDEEKKAMEQRVFNAENHYLAPEAIYEFMMQREMNLLVTVGQDHQSISTIST
jgi:hypothetical protein